MLPHKLTLAHLPTPIHRIPALDALVGCELWIKRDDMTAGAEAGNKIRKLEYLLADAKREGCDTVITCGGLQSNHARATTLVARRLGMAPHLLLRCTEPPTGDPTGNLFLDQLAGARIHYVTPQEYAARETHMRGLADALTRLGHRSYVIPEGGSNGLGSLGYVDAMREVRAQVDSNHELPKQFDAVVHACGSGGTAAGVALGIADTDLAARAIAIAVCDDRAHFETVTARIVDEARALVPTLPAPAPLRIEDAWKGPAYAVPSPEQVAFIRDVARASGVVLDPAYTGKALFGLAQMDAKPARALFIHTGGLPGLLADSQGSFSAR